MSDAAWRDATDPEDLFRLLKPLAVPEAERKLRLFACAAWRACDHLLTRPEEREAIATAERYADNRATFAELGAIRPLALGVACGRGATAAVEALRAIDARYRGRLLESRQRHGWDGTGGSYRDWQAASVWASEQVHEKLSPLISALLREIFGNPFRPVSMEDAWRYANDRCVVRLAETIYDHRRWSDLPLLADALLDAGCDQEVLLAHLRQPEGHVPGCWALDLCRGSR